MTTAVVIPAKRLDLAKTRLALPSGQRRSLMMALLVRTVSVAVTCARTEHVAVVTDDPHIATIASRLGATPVPEPGRRGLNAAFEEGRRWAREQTNCVAVALLVADLARLEAAELSTLFERFLLRRVPLMVTDQDGTGTTCVVHDVAFPPPLAFGPGSAARHLALGYVPAGNGLCSMRRDVDTVSDLGALFPADLSALGLVAGNIIRSPRAEPGIPAFAGSPFPDW